MTPAKAMITKPIIADVIICMDFFSFSASPAAVILVKPAMINAASNPSAVNGKIIPVKNFITDAKSLKGPGLGISLGSEEDVAETVIPVVIKKVEINNKNFLYIYDNYLY